MNEKRTSTNLMLPSGDPATISPRRTGSAAAASDGQQGGAAGGSLTA